MPHVCRAFRIAAVKAVSTKNSNVSTNGNASPPTSTRDSSTTKTTGTATGATGATGRDRTATSTKKASALF